MVSCTRICSLLVLLFAFTLAACSSPEQEKQEHFRKAITYKENNDPKAAVLELLNAIKIDGKFADARYQLGLLYLEQGEHQKAFGELVRAADLDHNNLDANLKAAEFYLVGRKKQECRQLIDRILAIDPKYRDALTLLANLELINGQFDKALAAVDSIGDEAKTSDVLLNIRGRILAAQEKWDEAEQSFKQAIDADTTNFNNYRSLLSLYQERKETEKYKALLDDINIKFPDDPRTYQLLAAHFMQQGNREEAEKALVRVVETAPDLPRHRLELATFYEQSGKMDEAEKVLVKAMADLAHDPDIGAALAGLYFDKGDLDQAAKLLKEVQEKNPKHGGATLLQARFLIKEGKNRDAMVILSELNNNYPKWAEPYFYLGIANLNLGETDLAQHAIATAIETDKRNPQYRTLLAQLLLLQGAYEQAEKEAALALRLSKNNMRAAIIIGRARIGTKDFKHAEELFSRLKKIAPNSTEILGNLAVAAMGNGKEQLAETTLAELLTIDPANTQAIAMLIRIRHKNDPAAAATFIRERIQQTPDATGLYMLLGGILERSGQPADGLAAYEKARELSPENTSAYIAAGRLLVRLDRRDEAMTMFEQILEKQPDSVAGQMGIGTLFELEGNTEAAMERYKKVLELRPSFVPAANNLAFLTASAPNGDLGEALRLAMLAKQAAPDEPHICDTLGWVHYRRGSNTLAIPQFELALQHLPGDPTITYHLALALHGDGQNKQAIELLTEVLSDEKEFSGRSDAEALLTRLKSIPQ